MGGNTRRWKGAGALLGLLVSSAIFAASASAAIYWGNWTAIGAASLDGSSQVSSFLRNAAWDIEDDSLIPRIHGTFLCGVAASPSHLYWLENGVVARIAFDGGKAVERLVGGAPRTCGIAVDGSYVYWSSGGGNLGRVSVNGGAADLDFIDDDGSLCDVGVTDHHVYWVDGGGDRIGRAWLDGSHEDPTFIDDYFQRCVLAVSDYYLYWSGVPDRISRASLDGNDVDEEFITDAGNVTSLAVHGQHIYWTNTDAAISKIGRARLNGSEVDPDYLDAGGGWAVTGIAVDSRPLVLPPRESNPVQFGRVSHNRRRGIAFMKVMLPASGAVKVTSAGLRARILGDSHPAADVGPPQVWLKLWPRRKGRIAKRIRRQLQRRGKAAAMFKLVYQEDGELPFTTRKRLALKRAVGKGRR